MHWTGILTCLAVFLSGLPAEAEADAVLTAIEMAPVSGGAAANLRIEGPEIQYEAFSLVEPARFVVDLYATDARIPALITSPETVHRPVRGIRTGRHQPLRARVVFDLEVNPRTIDIVLTSRATESGTELSVSFRDPAAATEQTETPATPAPEQALPEGPSKSSTGAGRSLVFGAVSSAPNAAQPSTVNSDETRSRSTQGLNVSLTRGLIEAGYLDGDMGSGANLHTQGILTLSGALNDHWSMHVSGRFDSQNQFNDLANLNQSHVDYDETWLRYRSGRVQITAGAQRILWGRADEFAPTDRLSTRDYTRLILDDVQHRRRANPAIRSQWFGDNQTLDLVFMPDFREAELPGSQSVWFPVDASNGSVAGLPLTPAQSTALLGATVRNNFEGSEGFGLRYSGTRANWDYAVTGQRVNNPEPYFVLGRPPTLEQAARLDAVYPRTWVLGADSALALGAFTLRGELAWLSDSPYTDQTNFELKMSEELSWSLGTEVFPGDRDFRITAQVAGRHLLDAENAIDFEDIISFLGELEQPFDRFGLPWRAQLRYSLRLDERANYLNPELALIAFEPSEIYLGIHLFSGQLGTQQGFYRDRDTVVIGWRAQF